MKSIALIVFATLLFAFTATAVELKQPGAYRVTEADLVYAQAGDVKLQARTYKPEVSGAVPVLIDVHGGVWSSGDRMAGQLYNRALASAGLFVFAIDFRQAPAFRHPSANQDIAAAIRYVRLHAKELGVDVNSIGLVGSSSGGHLAMLSGFTPANPQFSGTLVAADGAFKRADEVSTSVNYVIALWPVSDPAFRYEYAKRIGRGELLKSHDAYFGSTAVMTQASVPRLLRAKEATELPALMIVQPGKDANIPREMTFDLLAAYQEAGGRAEYVFYPDQPHMFGHRPSTDSTHLAQAMRDFIARTLPAAN